jgi:acetylornithine deacetylase/succinyl-diaminopimelate desuccinylase-like protein
MYTIKNWMGVPVVSGGGVGYPESGAHAPNENIRIDDYIRSIKFVATLITSF